MTTQQKFECPTCGQMPYAVSIRYPLGVKTKHYTCSSCRATYEERANTHADTQTRNLGPIAREIELSRELEQARQNVAQAMAALFMADEVKADWRKAYVKSGGDAAQREEYDAAMQSRRTACNALIVAKNALAEIKTRIQREKNTKR